VVVALLAGGALVTGCRPENSEVGRPHVPLNQQQKTPASGYSQDPQQKSQGVPMTDNWQEHPAQVGDGEQTQKAGQEPTGKLGEAASDSAKGQLEQMKKEEEENERAIGGAGSEDDAKER
jgi:hypothetical protein